MRTRAHRPQIKKATTPCTACQCGLEGCSTAEHHGPYVGGSGFFSNGGVPDNANGKGPPGRGDPKFVPLDAHAADNLCPTGRDAAAVNWSRSIERVAQLSFARGATGAAALGSFTSEFGAVAMPSFESLSATLQPSHWSLHSPAMRQRNWPACPPLPTSVASQFPGTLLARSAETRCCAWACKKCTGAR